MQVRIQHLVHGPPTVAVRGRQAAAEAAARTPGDDGQPTATAAAEEEGGPDDAGPLPPSGVRIVWGGGRRAGRRAVVRGRGQRGSRRQLRGCIQAALGQGENEQKPLQNPDKTSRSQTFSSVSILRFGCFPGPPFATASLALFATEWRSSSAGLERRAYGRGMPA